MTVSRASFETMFSHPPCQVVSPDADGTVVAVVLEIKYLHVNEETQAEEDPAHAHGLRGAAPLRERHQAEAPSTALDVVRRRVTRERDADRRQNTLIAQRGRSGR